jgi:acetyl esterase/lipase
MRRVILYSCLLVAVLGAISARFFIPDDVPIIKDIVYTAGDAKEPALALDLALPSGKGPFPLVICIHGGAWRSGTRSSYHALLQTLSRNGFVAATIDYRLAPAAKFPSQVHDVKAAVRFLRANAVRFNIDPDRIGVLGDSSGGHLALMLGLTSTRDNLEGQRGNAEHTSTVQAIVNYYGPTDFTVSEAWQEAQLNEAIKFLGTNDMRSEIAKTASPTTYIDRNDPPILSVHGDRDPIVPVSQARHLHQRLESAGVTQHLKVVKSAGHGWQGEDAVRVEQLTIEFLAEHLKHR